MALGIDWHSDVWAIAVSENRQSRNSTTTLIFPNPFCTRLNCVFRYTILQRGGAFIWRWMKHVPPDVNPSFPLHFQHGLGQASDAPPLRFSPPAAVTPGIEVR